MNDERFEARLRELLGAAGADAPTTMHEDFSFLLFIV